MLGVRQLPAARSLRDQVRVNAHDRERRLQIVEDLFVPVARRVRARASGDPVTRLRCAGRFLPGAVSPERLERGEERGCGEADREQREELGRRRQAAASERHERGDAENRDRRVETRRALSLEVPREGDAGGKEQPVRALKPAGQRERAEEEREVGQSREGGRERSERCAETGAREHEEREERPSGRERESPRFSDPEGEREEREEREEPGRGNPVCRIAGAAHRFRHKCSRRAFRRPGSGSRGAFGS